MVVYIHTWVSPLTNLKHVCIDLATLALSNKSADTLIYLVYYIGLAPKHHEPLLRKLSQFATPRDV